MRSFRNPAWHKGGFKGGALDAEAPPSKFYYMSKVESF